MRYHGDQPLSRLHFLLQHFVIQSYNRSLVQFLPLHSGNAQPGNGCRNPWQIPDNSGSPALTILDLHHTGLFRQVLQP